MRADRLFRGRRIDRAGAQIELRRVQWALHLAPLDPAIGQRSILVGAGVVDGEELAVISVEDRDRYALGLGTVETQGFTGLNCRAQTSGEHGLASPSGSAA